jgi:hypothetical protein
MRSQCIHGIRQRGKAMFHDRSFQFVQKDFFSKTSIVSRI